MAAFPPAGGKLPSEFPIFPLTGALLLPQGRLPLNIFEPRYLAMTEDALAAGRMFAMIQPDSQKPTGPYGPSLYSVGCLGRLTSFSETDDGRYLITLLGISRFHVAEELGMQRGYRRVRADFSSFVNDIAIAPAQQAGFDRAGLLDALRNYFVHRGFEANWDSINQMPDDMLLTTLCMVCPFEPVERQALLEAPSITDRAYALLTLLEIDTHEAPEDEPGTVPRRPRAS